MKLDLLYKVVIVFVFGVSLSYAQTSTVLTYTGSPQNWVVPPCVTSITVNAYGADGGGTYGGNGAMASGTFSVTPGQTIQVIVGGSGSCPGAGYNGGGSGQNANTSANGSCGGGGASQINIGGTPVLIAAGGGGMGGGTDDGTAGVGGCASGTAGSTTFGVGAGGGTQSAGGTGGPPWISSGNAGQNGSLGQGGNGATDPCYNNSPGGGGGGGYYGGGGGGSDCYDLAPYGGGGGGGGSSLVPAGGTCNAGVNNGQGYVTISYSGGTATASNTGPYCEGSTIQLNSSSSPGSTYNWSGPNGFSSNVANPTIPNATLANAGNYSLTISGGACNGTVSTNVIVNAAPSPNAGTDQNICLGDPILLSGVLSSGSNTPLWSYLAPGIAPAPTVNFTPNTSSLTPSVSVNQIGTYYFILQEQNSLCPIQYDTVVVNVSELTVSSSYTDPTCSGAADGSISITSAGAIEYSFDGGTTWVSNSSSSSLIAGNYTVCARTATGCQECINVVLTDPAPSSVTVSNTGPYCEGTTIQLNSSASPGSTYSWTGPNGFSSNLPNPTIPNSTIGDAGSYNLSISGGSCSGSGSTNVVVNPLPTPNSGVDQNICLGSSASLSGVISNSSNSFQWSYNAPGIVPVPVVNINPNTTTLNPTVDMDQVGTYYFILEEQNALCPIQYDTVIVNVSQLSISATSTNPTCSGGTDGTISINSSGASEYSFDGGTTWSTNSSAASLAAGNYNVCSRTTTGCLECTNVILNDPPPVTISVSNDTLICQNGTAFLTAIGGGGSTFQYHWDFTNDLSGTQQVNPNVNGTYSVYAENEFGCLSQSESIEVTIRLPLTGIISLPDTVCPTFSSNVSANVSGGLGAPYTFVWSTGDSQTGPNNHLINVTPNSTTTYTVTITDECESTPLVLSTHVYVAPLPVPSYTILNPYQCEPAIFDIVNSNLSQNVNWVIDGNQIFNNQDTIQTSVFWAGQYDIQMVVTSNLGCVDSLTFTNAINVELPPIADFNISPNPATMFNTNVIVSQDAFNGDTYQWYFDQGSPLSANGEQVQVKFPEGETGEYEITLIVTSALGCKDTITKLFQVIPEVIIYVPNTFTPDGDSYNQTWKVIMSGIDLQSFELLIFNRWGEIIWESHDVSVGWDGTYNGNPVQEGTYVWKIQAKEIINDGKVTYTGHLNLIR